MKLKTTVENSLYQASKHTNDKCIQFLHLADQLSLTESNINNCNLIIPRVPVMLLIVRFKCLYTVLLNTNNIL